MARKMMLIVNPYSGRGLSKSALGTIVSGLCDSDYVVTVYFTGENTAEELAYEHAKYQELVVCVGGDGTLSSVVSGVLRCGATAHVGYIPAGTSNDVAATLALSKNPSVASQMIIEGKPSPLDIGCFGGRYFTYVAAFGAFTGVAYQTPQSAKRALGHFAYVLGGLSGVGSIKARRTVVEYDGGVLEDDFIFGGVMNSTSVAGVVKLDPKRVDLSDGMFEVILVKQPLNIAEFADILTSIVTTSYDGDNIQMMHASEVKFSFEEEVPWTVDGEFGGNHREVSITNLREAIQIIV